MKRTNRKLTVLNKGIRLTEEIAPRDLETVTGGKPPV